MASPFPFQLDPTYSALLQPFTPSWSSTEGLTMSLSPVPHPTCPSDSSVGLDCEAMPLDLAIYGGLTPPPSDLGLWLGLGLGGDGGDGHGSGDRVSHVYGLLGRTHPQPLMMTSAFALILPIHSFVAAPTCYFSIYCPPHPLYACTPQCPQLPHPHPIPDSSSTDRALRGTPNQARSTANKFLSCPAAVCAPLVRYLLCDPV
ncbi:hypothetical protein B0H14DRAFT_3441723 [Mycena olivaceomarginata]|nr:hypothetical protein B0H14DRAFT_3441723 [Mycena olivaceomarginata]